VHAGDDDDAEHGGRLARARTRELLAPGSHPEEPMNDRILVVDDDPDLRELLALLLGEAGFAVATAADGREALREVERAMPRLILLDMRMPVMDGAAFARAFAERFGGLATIVVVTAAENARRRAEEVGADGWIGKPFAIDEVLSVARRYVEHEPRAAS
jgi:CheY-like chemotaxis protein